MVILRMISFLFNNCCFCFVFYSKLEEDFLYMVYVDIMVKVKKVLILMFILIKGNYFYVIKDKNLCIFGLK